MARLLIIPVLAVVLSLAIAAEAKAWTFSFQYSDGPGYTIVDKEGHRHQRGYSGFTYSHGRYPPYYKPYYRYKPYWKHRPYRHYGRGYPDRYYYGWRNWSRHEHERRNHRDEGNRFPSHRPRHRR